MSKTILKHFIFLNLKQTNKQNKQLASVGQTFFPLLLRDKCNPALLELYTCLYASGLLTVQLPSVRLRHMDQMHHILPHISDHPESSVDMLHPIYPPSRCCTSSLMNLRALKSVPCIYDYYREMRTHGRQARGKFPAQTSLYGLPGQKWPVRLLEISFCGSCGPAQLQRLTFNGARPDFYFRTKRESVGAKGCEHIRGRSCWMNTVDKSKKGARNDSQVADNVTTQEFTRPHRLCIPSFCLPLSAFLSLKRATFTCGHSDFSAFVLTVPV